MEPSDLVSIIDTANQSVKQTDWFWNASKEDRELYKQYYSKKKNATKLPAVIAEEGGDEVGEDENDDDDIGQEEDREIEQAGSADEVLDVATAAPETEGPPPKRERSIAQKRYQDYLQIAREELKKQGNQKISMGECHALCKQMLEEDGWR
jgi:hypothetical protein